MIDYYERDVGIAKHAAQSGRVFIDIGANEGSWALPLARAFETVHAFEPDQRALAKIVKNRLVSGRKNINVHYQAVMDYDGFLDMEAFDNSVYTTPIPGFRSSGVRATNAHIIRVPCTTLDTFVKEQQLDLSPTSLIKIDVEGGELAVLNGARETIGEYKPDLFIEVHSEENLTDAMVTLTDYGYRLELVRHPDYKLDNPAYHSHLWISAVCPSSIT